MTNEQFIMDRVKWYEDQMAAQKRRIIENHETIIDLQRELAWYKQAYEEAKNQQPMGNH